MKEVGRDQLEAGKLYYLESYTIAYNENNEYDTTVTDITIIIGDRIIPIKMNYKRKGIFVKWEDGIYGGKFSNFTNFSETHEDKYSGCDVQLISYWWKFYEIQKHDIQQNMETR